MKTILFRFARWLARKTAPGYLPTPTTSLADVYRRRHTPTAGELLAELKSTAWTCASINASVG